MGIKEPNRNPPLGEPRAPFTQITHTLIAATSAMNVKKIYEKLQIIFCPYSKSNDMFKLRLYAFCFVYFFFVD